jgi:hypothetical protein
MNLQRILLEAGQSGNTGEFRKQGMHKGSGSWKEEKNMCMHGGPNDVRVRVFATHCNGWQARNI